LAERLVDGIDDLRNIEVARLDALQAALCPRAQRGDGPLTSATLPRFLIRKESSWKARLTGRTPGSLLALMETVEL
jgi:hypothetical protein